MVLTYDEFRKVKDSLPDGAMSRIASELKLEEETVRNFFGGTKYAQGNTNDVHYEKGANGGFVRIENPEILEQALSILGVDKVAEIA